MSLHPLPHREVCQEMSLFKVKYKGRESWCVRTVDEEHPQRISEKFRLYSFHGQQRDHSEWSWILLSDIPKEKLLLTVQEMLAIGITDKAKPWNPALNMCILCCQEEKGNVCKSLSCFSIKEGEFVLTLPTPDLSVKSKHALGRALLCAYSSNMKHLLCAIDGWHTYVPKNKFRKANSIKQHGKDVFLDLAYLSTAALSYEKHFRLGGVSHSFMLR